MIKIIKKCTILTLLLSAVACQRAADEKKSVVISLPPVEKLSGYSSCTTCLKFLAVNVSGEGISQVIYAKKEQGNFSETGTEITPDIEVDVPVGRARNIQLVAAYSNATDDIEVKYGSVITDLTASTGTVSLSVTSLGLFEGGHITGRYLTGQNFGPTGIVNIKLVPASGLTPFTLMKTSILNGWFDFFASKNFEVTYEMENGKILFSNIKLDRDFSATSLSGNTQIARVTRPTSYYRDTGASGWVQENDDDSDLVIGYFFEPGVSDPNKHVCKLISPMTLTRLSFDNGATFMTYDPTGSSGDVRVHGGNSTCGGDYGQQYGADTISINGEQFDGMGNDTAKSMQGAFSFFKDGTSIRKYGRSSSILIFRFLPTLLGGLFDSAKLYVSTVPVSSDDVICTENSLSTHGFTAVTTTVSSSAANLIYLNTGSVISSGYGFVCPTRSGQLYGFGGMYLGNLTP